MDKKTLSVNIPSKSFYILFKPVEYVIDRHAANVTQRLSIFSNHVDLQ